MKIIKTDFKKNLKSFLEIITEYQLRSTKLPDKLEENPYEENIRISNRFIPHRMIVVDADQEYDTRVLSLIHGLISAVHHKERDLNSLSPRKIERRLMYESIKLYEDLYGEKNDKRNK